MQIDRHMLAVIGADLVRRLSGQWRDGGGMCLCPAHADRSPSLSIRMGDKSLLFHCFAGCDNGDVLAAIRRLQPGALAAAATPAPPLRSDDRWLRSRAADIWDDARPIGGTVAERYLRARSITIGSDALRYHAQVPLGRGRAMARRAALIAKVSDDSRILAIQRIFLDRHARRARDLGNPRRLLGRPGAGAVRLAIPDAVLGLAEGVETALSAMILLGIPVWAVLGNERFSHVAVPETVSRIILLPDNDRAGCRGASAAHAALRTSCRQIDIIYPWRGLNDWNDVLRSEGEEAGSRMRIAV